MSASCQRDVGCGHVETRVKTTDICLSGWHVADMLRTCCTSINQVEQLLCDVKKKIIIMIGKRAQPPKKPNVLFLLVLMYHLNSIPLWSLPYQFTCKLQWERLIIVFIISTNTNKEPSITSPPVELHTLFPNWKWFPWVRIMKDETFIFFKQLRLGNTVFCSFVLPLPNLPPMPKKHA